MSKPAIDPESWRKLAESSDALDAANLAAKHASEHWASHPTDEAREAWRRAVLAQRQAWDEYWAIHHQYLERLGPA